MGSSEPRKMTAREGETLGVGGGEHDLGHGHYAGAQWHGVDTARAWARGGGGGGGQGRGHVGKVA